MENFLNLWKLLALTGISGLCKLLLCAEIQLPGPSDDRLREALLEGGLEGQALSADPVSHLPGGPDAAIDELRAHGLVDHVLDGQRQVEDAVQMSGDDAEAAHSVKGFDDAAGDAGPLGRFRAPADLVDEN